jgi:hypothetical protein
MQVRMSCLLLNVVNKPRLEHALGNLVRRSSERIVNSGAG